MRALTFIYYAVAVSSPLAKQSITPTVKRAIDESSIAYYWFDGDNIERGMKTVWREVPDSAFIDVTGDCTITENFEIRLPVYSQDLYYRVQKVGLANGNSYFRVQRIDMQALADLIEREVMS